MKTKLSILLLFVCLNLFGQSVPNTTTFSLQDVVNAVNPTTDDLVDCFADADAAKFDPTYSGSKNNLLNFKNYENTCRIGAPYQGGIVAYILVSGDAGYVAGQCHGLIAAVNDQAGYPTGVVWGCWGTDLSGAQGTVIGTGNQNTIDIMAGCATAGIAARICGNLNEGGYTDWYLPSYYELSKLCLNKTAIGNFGATDYWSSSESDESGALGFSFIDCTGLYYAKDQSHNVRAVRSF